MQVGKPAGDNAAEDADTAVHVFVMGVPTNPGRHEIVQVCDAASAVPQVLLYIRCCVLVSVVAGHRRAGRAKIMSVSCGLELHFAPLLTAGMHPR